MKKFAPWVIAVLLLLYGLPTLTKSVLGGLFFIIAGLALLPTTKNLLIQKVPQAALLDKPIVNYIAVAIFAVLGVMATGASEKAALIEKYTANKEAITKEITDLDAAKDFIMAEIKLKPYLNAMPTDSELRALSEKIKADAKQDKEEKAAKKAKEEADKKAAAQREADQKSSNASNGKTEYTRNKYTEKDASAVAFCFAYLEVSKQPYLAHLEKTHKLYVQDNAAVFYEEIQPAIQKLIQCAGSNINDPATVQSCKGQLPKEAPLINEFQRGGAVLQAGSKSDKAIASAACMAVDALIR